MTVEQPKPPTEESAVSALIKRGYSRGEALSMVGRPDNSLIDQVEGIGDPTIKVVSAVLMGHNLDQVSQLTGMPKEEVIEHTRTGIYALDHFIQESQ